MFVRLQKYLAVCGIASRRKAEELITKGQVKVNGVVVTELGTKIDDKLDVVEFKGKEVKQVEDKVYIMLHKPYGYVTTVKDQFERPTVIDLLYNVKERVFPVGRLDYDTSGLILMTNDGDVAYKMTHPKHSVDKVYMAKLKSKPSDKALQMFRDGLMIDGKKTSRAKIDIEANTTEYCYVKITITEGRNRQVRKMCDEIGSTVISLKRVGMGQLRLSNLAKGEYRHLTAKEIAYLKQQ